MVNKKETSEPKNQILQMRVSKEFLTEIDQWRREQEDLPPRAEAVRRLVKTGIEASKESNK